MNRQDLRKEFDLMHVPGPIYNLDGESFPEKTTISGFGSNWTVFLIDERGKKVNVRIFKSEEEACQYLYDIYSKWFNYKLRDFNKIFSLLETRPQFKSGEKLERFFAGLDFKFPDTIPKFYKNYDGAEGFFGQNIWINILPTESFNERNIFYKMSLSLKDYFLFAIDQTSDKFEYT